MINEDYVSFEIAKLLKEKGFNIPTHTFYNTKKDYILKFDPCLIDRNAGIYVSAPTLQKAMKWLREMYNIYIVITPSMFWGKYNASIYKKGNIYPYGFDGDSLVSSYEKAVENAIKYCLENLI